MPIGNGDSRMRKPHRILFLLFLLGVLAWVLWWFSREQETSFIEVSDAVFATTPLETHRAPAISPVKTIETRDFGPSTDREARLIHVRVEDVAGVPLTGRSVLLIDEGGRRKQGVTDVEGEVAFPHPGSGRLVAHFLGCAPVVRRVAPDRDTYTLRRSSGLRIEGKLLIDGRPPGRSLAFSASVYQSGLTNRFYHAIGREAHDSDLEPIPIRCDPDGEFDITGLRAGWKIRINLPDGLRMRAGDPDQGRRVRYIEVLREDIHLDLFTERDMRVYGRCVDRDGVPLRGVPIQVRVSRKSRHHGDTPLRDYRRLETDEGGRFATWLKPNSFSRIQFVAWWGGVEISKDIGTFGSRERSLPDFVFPRVRELRLQVVDEHGEPVGGATVGTADGRFIRTVDGNGDITLPLIPTQPLNLHIAAPGFAFETIVITRPSPAGIEVQLQRASHVVIAVKDSRGQPIASRKVNLRFAEIPLSRRGAFDSPIYRKAHPGLWFSRRDRVYGIIGTTNDQGELVIGDLKAGLEVVARIFGRGGPLVSVVHEVKGLLEERIDLTIPADAATAIVGRIVSASGRPVPDALVLIGDSERRLIQAGFSDDEGRFFIDDVVFRPLHVQIGKIGYRSASRFIPDPRERQDPIRFVLQQSTQCRLLVKEADGRMMKKAHVELPWVHHPGMGPVVLKKGPGTFEIVDIGNEPCHPVIYGPGGTKRKITIRPDVDTLKIVHWD